MFMLSFIFVILCFFEWGKIFAEFYCVFISVLSLKIHKLVEIPLTGLIPPYCCAYQNQDVQPDTPWPYFVFNDLSKKNKNID